MYCEDEIKFNFYLIIITTTYNLEICYKLLFTNKNCLISLDFIYFALVLKCISISRSKISFQLPVMSVIIHFLQVSSEKKCHY